MARAELLQQATQAGLSRLDQLEAEEELGGADPVPEILRQRLEQRDFAAWERLGTMRSDGRTDVPETPSERYTGIRLAMLQAERERVLALRTRGRVPHEVVEDVLRMLDVEESVFDTRPGRTGSSPGPSTTCEHLAAEPLTVGPADHACEDCLVEGTEWVHLRQCTHCGHVGCCDSSPGRHAERHFTRLGHPVMRSVEPGEEWRWCFVDEIVG